MTDVGFRNNHASSYIVASLYRPLKHHASRIPRTADSAHRVLHPRHHVLVGEAVQELNGLA
jgi:hypothetical protein